MIYSLGYFTTADFWFEFPPVQFRIFFLWPNFLDLVFYYIFVYFMLLDLNFVLGLSVYCLDNDYLYYVFWFSYR